MMATPVGSQKLAEEPAPSAKSHLLLPASVETSPLPVTRRMRWLFVSATTMFPLDGMTATLCGPLKLAAVPVPSANARLPLPASVVTTPCGVTRRMRSFPESATIISPLDGTIATP